VHPTSGYGFLCWGIHKGDNIVISHKKKIDILDRGREGPIRAWEKEVANQASHEQERLNPLKK